MALTGNNGLVADLRSLWDDLCELDVDGAPTDATATSEHARLIALKAFITEDLSSGSAFDDIDLLWAAELDEACKEALCDVC